MQVFYFLTLITT